MGTQIGPQGDGIGPVPARVPALHPADPGPEPVLGWEQGVERGGPTAPAQQVFPTPPGSTRVERGRWSPLLHGMFPIRQESHAALRDTHTGRGQPGVPRCPSVSLNPARVAGAGCSPHSGRSGAQVGAAGMWELGRALPGVPQMLGVSETQPSSPGTPGPPRGSLRAPGAVPPPLVLSQLAGAGSVSGISRAPD